MQSGKPWSEEEVKFLLENYTSLTVNEMASALQRTHKSVWHKLRTLGLKAVKAEFICPNGNVWTEEEIRYATQHYPELTPAEIGEKLNRSERSVWNKLRYLGVLKSKVNRKAWTKEETEYLIDNYSQKGAFTVAKYLNRSRKSVQKKARSLGISMFDDGYLKAKEIARIFHCDMRMVTKWINKYGLPCKVVHHNRSRKTPIISYNILLDDFWNWAEQHKEIINWKRYTIGSLPPEPSWVYSAIQNDQHHENSHMSFRMSEKKKIIRLYQTGHSVEEIAKTYGRSSYSIRDVINKTHF